MPNSQSSSKHLKPRQIFYVSSSRIIPHSNDPDDDPIVSRMTRNRLRNMSPANAKAWAKQSMDSIQSATKVNEQQSIMTFMKRDSPAAGPSGATAPVAKKVKRTPDTPPGVTPSQRNGEPGKAILAFSPWV